MIRRLLDWLITLGGSWHPVSVRWAPWGAWNARCPCGWASPWWRRHERAAWQDAYDHQQLGGRA